LITDPLSVALSGTASLKAADASALNGKTVVTRDGLLFVAADFTGSATDFTVQVADAEGNGWISNGAKVEGKAGLTGDQKVEVRMVNARKAATVNASTAPIAMTSSSGTTTASGALTATVVAQTAPKTAVTDDGKTQEIGVAAVSIPAGTVGKTDSGAPAAAGPLTVTSTYYSNASSESLAALPGGFTADVVVPAANSSVLRGIAPDAGALVTAGFAQFNVTDSQGNAIKKFDRPLSLSIDIPKGTPDADGNPAAVGSQYPVWSYDDATGKWVFETMGAVAEKSPVDPQNYAVNFTTTHLSTWNVAYWSRTCNARINVVGRPAGDTRQLRIAFIGTTIDNRGKVGVGGSYTIQDNFLEMQGAPDISATNVWVLDVAANDKVVGFLEGQKFCGGPINVPITLPPAPSGDVTVEAFEACPDGSKQRAVYLPLQLRYNFKNGNTSWTTAPGYATSPNAANPLSQGLFKGIAVGNVDMLAQDPRTKAWVRTNDIKRNGATATASVVNGQTTVFRFRFNLDCKVVTGSSGG
jgi:hypothetical protein